MTSSIFRTRRADSGLERGEARSPVLGIGEAFQVCAKGESVTPGLSLEPITQLVADLDRRRHTLSIPTPTGCASAVYPNPQTRDAPIAPARTTTAGAMTAPFRVTRHLPTRPSRLAIIGSAIMPINPTT